MRYLLLLLASLVLPQAASAQADGKPWMQRDTHSRSPVSFEADTDPVISEHPDGSFFDARTGEILTKEQIQDIEDRNDGEISSLLVLYRTDDPYSKTWRQYGDDTANIAIGKATAN